MEGEMVATIVTSDGGATIEALAETMTIAPSITDEIGTVGMSGAETQAGTRFVAKSVTGRDLTVVIIIVNEMVPGEARRLAQRTGKLVNLPDKSPSCERILRRKKASKCRKRTIRRFVLRH